MNIIIYVKNSLIITKHMHNVNRILINIYTLHIHMEEEEMV